jgi:Flp pilus assembly protein TadG
LRRFAAALRASDGGATALEFAIAARAMLLLLFGCFELSQVFWRLQALQAAAASTARCAAIQATSCLSQASSQQYFVTAATNFGVGGVSSSAVTIAPTDTCGTTVANNSFTKVSLTYSFSSAVGDLIPLPSAATVSACYPNSH